MISNDTQELSGNEHECSLCETTFNKARMRFCPTYNQLVSTSCSNPDVRCEDQCREDATLSAQALSFFKRYFSVGNLHPLSTSIAQSLLLTLLLTGISATILVLIYWQIPMTTPELKSVFTATLFKIFFFLLIIIGVVSWLFTLARFSNRLTLNELRAQTKALATEVAAHERTARAYQLAKEEAESANKAKSRYLAGLSHELITPLNVLLGYAQLLSSDGRMPKHAKEPLHTMKRNGEYLSDLIEGVLEVSKIEAGRLSVHREDFQLRPLLEQLVAMFQQQAISKGLTLNYHFPTHLPHFVSGDKQRLRQILINLISNAVKFTQHGSVSFSVRYRNEVGHFVIEDTGPGIDEKDQEVVFHPFERVSDSNTAVSGTGLGLTISRALAELMGGDISLTSTPGQGSSFSVSLMLPRLTDNNRVPVDKDNSVTGYEGPRKTVVTIDDEADQRQLMHDILTPLGFRVITANDASEGIAMLEQHPIDLILLDLKMPKISGWQAAKMIRQLGSKVPIIIVSANVRELDMEDNAQQYHNDYLTKPFVINNLIDKLGHWLNIEWIKHDDESHVQSTIENAQNKPLVGKNQYQALKSLAEIGYLSGFSAKLEDISDHYYMPMETQKTLKQLASQIQFAKVVEKLDEHINRL